MWVSEWGDAKGPELRASHHWDGGRWQQGEMRHGKGELALQPPCSGGLGHQLISASCLRDRFLWKWHRGGLWPGGSLIGQRDAVCFREGGCLIIPKAWERQTLGPIPLPVAGTSSGSVLVFDIPSKGTNIMLSEVLEQHSSAITDIGTELCEQPVRPDLASPSPPEQLQAPPCSFGPPLTGVPGPGSSLS